MGIYVITTTYSVCDESFSSTPQAIVLRTCKTLKNNKHYTCIAAVTCINIQPRPCTTSKHSSSTTHKKKHVHTEHVHTFPGDALIAGYPQTNHTQKSNMQV